MRARTARGAPAGVAIVALLVAACGSPARGAASAEPVPVATVDVQLSAHALSFQPASLQVPSGIDVAIRFENADIGVGHQLIVDRLGANAAHVARAQPTVGPEVATYLVPALPAGGYRIGCAIHPAMAAALVAT
jgi:plastocyanin